MFQKILIANRGEIVARTIRTLRRLGVSSVAVYSDPDRFTRPVLDADESVRIGPAAARESYLNIDAIIDACKMTGAEAVFPGYGFLSESAAFAERLRQENIAFIGPRPEHLRDFGLKHQAREIAQRCGVPLLPGSNLLESLADARGAAAAIGYPVMLKSTAGGGGIGMMLCHEEAELIASFNAVQRMAGANFGDARVYLERFVSQARHIEVQIFGLGDGRVLTLGERDCSLQRRNQKVIEETPAPGLSDMMRERIQDSARRLGEAVNYESAGTVEFIYDMEREAFYFLEVNTRLQVEHPVTEAAFGVDLIEWMIRLAAGEFVAPSQSALRPTGCAIELRVYAEIPQADFRPSTGIVTQLQWPKNARIDSWIETGCEISAHYDPMLAKIIVHGPDRPAAIQELQSALSDTRIYGLETNLDYLTALAANPAFGTAQVSTGFLKSFSFQSRAIEVVAPGALSSVQDWPGRLGYWSVGVPPSGPMDERSHRLANAIVGNPEHAAALECTFSGPTLRFHLDATIALTGAAMTASLDGAPVPYFQPVHVRSGQVLRLDEIEGPGQRTYLAFAGGIDAPLYLGSRAAFTLGKFGGHATGALRTGDTLKLLAGSPETARLLAPEEIPPLSREWTLMVRSGPHGAPDFFLPADIDDLFAARYEVHFNSARTGVRLIGPQPRWARKDGGEAGLHPSNIHDTPYAIGALDFTGDMPIILGPDGPSLGGFVCPVVVASEDLWKIGQLKPGDGVKFAPEPGYGGSDADPQRGDVLQSPILRQFDHSDLRVVYRRAGDENLLVEYGPMTLDFALRLRVHLLSQALSRAKLPGIVDLTPGIRSLQIHFDPNILSGGDLIDRLTRLESELPSPEDVTVPSRTIHLPLSWSDEAAELAMRKYQELVRLDAPWCPSNIEFIRRINGLPSIDAVRDIIFNAEYLVLGLGDVYLGAPVATPVDPRHRLVTTKYNPARTWTPENAVGIGGAYLCIYGMEGPGGYQLFGRTLQVWNSWRTTQNFEEGKPWLLRNFDRIRFFPVSAADLMEARAAFTHGRYSLRIDDGQFSYRDYARFLDDKAAEINVFKAQQQAAFEAERADWKARGLDTFVAETELAADPLKSDLPAGATAVVAHLSGQVWKIVAAADQVVNAGDPIAILESMKMEVPISAPIGGKILQILCREGKPVQVGEIIAVLTSAA